MPIYVATALSKFSHLTHKKEVTWSASLPKSKLRCKTPAHRSSENIKPSQQSRYQQNPTPCRKIPLLCPCHWRHYTCRPQHHRLRTNTRNWQNKWKRSPTLSTMLPLMKMPSSNIKRVTCTSNCTSTHRTSQNPMHEAVWEDSTSLVTILCPLTYTC